MKDSNTQVPKGNSSASSNQNGSQGSQKDDTSPANPNAGSFSGLSDDQTALQAELTAAQTKLEEMTNVAKQALADLQNVRRRNEEEKASFINFAASKVMLALLPILNSINLGLKHEPKDLEWAKGAEQIFKQFQEALAKQGLQEIPTVGQPFDPRFHEALLLGPGEKDLILEELEKGYMLGDRVLKQARVKVGSGEPA